MKKFLLLAGISILALQSCKQDELVFWDLEQMNGAWKYDKVDYVSGTDGKTVLNTVVYSGCEAQNTITFFDNVKVRLENYYKLGNGSCATLSDETMNFEYDSSSRILTMKQTDSLPKTFQVIVLTKDMMKVMPTDERPDSNFDDVPDYVHLYLKR